MKDISIIIVTYNRPKKLETLLSQVAEQFKGSEVIVVLNGGASEGYNQLINSAQVDWIEGKYKTPGSARNAGLAKATREWILFLDDDVEIPPDFSARAQEFLNHHAEKTDIFGGPDQDKAGSGTLTRALSLTLTSPMATAHTRLRHGLQTQEIKAGDESNLILCNLWVKRSFIIENRLSFNDHLFRNEENLFITEGLSRNGIAWYVPDLYVFHERKTGLLSLGRAVFSSGKNRIKSLTFSFKLFNPLFLVPSVFVLYLMALPFIYERAHVFTPLKVYLTLSLFMSLKVSIHYQRIWPLVLFYQIFINILYGLGALWGLLNFPLWLLRLKR